MPVFLVTGRDRKGEAFRRRFEAPSANDLQIFLATRSLHVASVRALPLSSWPFSRVPFIMMIFPLFAWGVISFGGAVIGGGLTLLREQHNQTVYETLAREGVTVEGRVIARHQEVQRRGKPIPVVEYQYRDPRGFVQRGALVGRPGNASKGTHDLSLLPRTELNEGDPLVVVVHPETPLLHAPFALDEEFLARHQALVEARRDSVLLSLAGLALCAWLVWNVALRLGSQLEHSSNPRIVELTSGPSVLAEVHAQAPGDGEGAGETPYQSAGSAPRKSSNSL
jgi:hypothetical protein